MGTSVGKRENRLVFVEEALLTSPRKSIDSIARSQLAQNRAHMFFDRGEGNDEPVSDVLIGGSIRKLAQDLQLARREWLNEQGRLTSSGRRGLSLLRKGVQEGTHILRQFFLPCVWQEGGE